MNKGNIDIITMGCSKNLVDSEQLLFLFERNGYNIYHNPTELHGDIVVVNTCGFIGDAKEESIQMILSLCDLKEEGRLNKVYVMGCLSERYLKELGEEIPQVNKFYGKFDWRCLLNDLDSTNVICDSTDRVLTTPSHYAYLKISEGCDRHCAYCAIPIITGKHQSRSEEEILEEVRTLVAKGVTEFQVIAQDLTYYGIDLYGKQTIAQLVKKMSEIPGVEWIRLHYAYPAHFPVDLLRVMREKKNVCKYLDIALQHVSDNMLTRMRRNITKAETVALIRKIREEVPGICLRTTLMVGFPGETDDDFRQLCEFVKEMRFERMGAFAYSEEEGTYAAINYEDDVPNDVKQQRLDELMAIQQRISMEVSGSYVGRKLKIIIDRKEGEYYIGRTEYDSPEVDCEVLINEKEMKIGGYYQGYIDSADEFDLYASIVE